MKEEYLEIEELDFNTHFDEQPHQSEAIQQNANAMEFPSTHPTDFDGQYDDAMLRKLLRKFQMSFLYPFLKGKETKVLIHLHLSCLVSILPRKL